MRCEGLNHGGACHGYGLNLSAAAAVGIVIGPAANYAQVTGNRIYNVGLHGIQVGDESSAAAPVAVIANNVIEQANTSAGTGYGLALMATSDVTDGGVISGNRFRNGTSTHTASIYITSNAGAPRYKNLSIFGNDIFGGGVLAIPTAGPNAMSFDALGYGSVASATTVTLPDTSNMISVTGTTQIDSITASWRGRLVTLVFASNPQVTDGSNLKLAGNFATSANDVLTLVCDGVNWYEVSRSAN